MGVSGELCELRALPGTPCLAGTDGGRPWHGPGGGPAVDLTLVADETLDGGLVWLLYRVTERAPAATG
ncbi:hypothetical protein ACFPA8_06205 [Streptomyces ovatisporus]|uniref:Uncharacterized protein n=1 Tax=Streptomyces ovatisporus TaxID=1128682 RepID=A0ABV9A5E0_9ACTN